MTQRAMNYAKVLFILNIPDEIVNDTKCILKNRELLDALSNPSIKKNEKHAVIDTIFDKEIRSFLKIVCDNNFIDTVGQIFYMYEGIVLESKKIIKATLAYVIKPADNQIKKIKEFVSNKYNKTGVLLELKEDASLIGGFILTVDDIEYDKSIKGTLSSLHKTLVWR
ncbi:MAG: ATP synthase F1 subunit delta [Sedimentibacter sp.]